MRRRSRGISGDGHVTTTTRKPRSLSEPLIESVLHGNYSHLVLCLVPIVSSWAALAPLAMRSCRPSRTSRIPMVKSHRVMIVGAAIPRAVVIADGSPMYAWTTPETAPPAPPATAIHPSQLG